MNQSEMAVTAVRLTDARAVLLRDYPFFGHLTMALQPACAPCGTACTDGSRLIFDPAFAGRLDEKELGFVILHEVLHCALGHCTRGKGMNRYLHNVACDIVVNSIILQMWGLESFRVDGEEPMHRAPDGSEGCLYSSEEVYDMLLAKYPSLAEAEKALKDGLLDRHDLWDGIESPGKVRDQWNRNILDAQKDCGDSFGAAKAIRELVSRLERQAKADWRQLLHDFLQQDGFDYSFLPPDRRYAAEDFFLPAFGLSEDESRANDLWVCVDTSASISERELSGAMDEILDAIRQAGLSGTISFFDSSVTPPVPFSSEEDLVRIRPVGGGGTSFARIFRYMQEELSPELPRAVLIFTDGYAPVPPESEAMGVPVFWLITKGGKADIPWGNVTQFEE